MHLGLVSSGGQVLPKCGASPYTRIHYGLDMRAPAVEVLPIHRDQIPKINLLFSS
jgi:hypothetical protein